MPEFVPIRIRTHAKIWCHGQEDRPRHRSAGTILGDVSIQNAATLIASGLADLWIGSTAGATFLNPEHPQSDYQCSLKRRRQEEALIRHFISQQPPA